MTQGLENKVVLSLRGRVGAAGDCYMHGQTVKKNERHNWFSHNFMSFSMFHATRSTAKTCNNSFFINESLLKSTLTSFEINCESLLKWAWDPRPLSTPPQFNHIAFHATVTLMKPTKLCESVISTNVFWNQRMFCEINEDLMNQSLAIPKIGF